MWCPQNISWQLIGSIPPCMESTSLSRQSFHTPIVRVSRGAYGLTIWCFVPFDGGVSQKLSVLGHVLYKIFHLLFNMEHYGEVMCKFLFTMHCCDLWCMKCIYILELWWCMRCMHIFYFWSVSCDLWETSISVTCDLWVVFVFVEASVCLVAAQE
jgi:hypothetical protein